MNATCPKCRAASGVDRTVLVSFTYPQVQALYLTLFHGRMGGAERPEVRPAWGWMEQPLWEIETALAPAHKAIHDRDFSALNRSFFGTDSRKLPEALMPASVPAAGVKP